MAKHEFEIIMMRCNLERRREEERERKEKRREKEIQHTLYF